MPTNKVAEGNDSGRASIEQKKATKKRSSSQTSVSGQQANLILNMADLVQKQQSMDHWISVMKSDKDALGLLLSCGVMSMLYIVLNYLYKHTQMEVTFGIINLALVINRESFKSKQLMFYYIAHRRVVIAEKVWSG